MPALTLYLTNALTDNWASLSENSPGTSALSSPVTGWVVGKIASGNYASFDANTERTTGGFTTTVQPDGTLDTTLYDAWRAGPFNGAFDTGNWTLQASLQSTTAATATNAINLRVRVFKSTNANGSGATEITGATILIPASTYYSLTTTGTAVTNSNTWNPGSLSLTNEYLFFQVACYINAASSSNSSDVNFRVGTGATLITTPNYTPTDYSVNASGVSVSTSVGTLTRSIASGITLSGVSNTSTSVGSVSRDINTVLSISGTSRSTSVGSLLRDMSTGTSLSGTSSSISVSSFAGASPYAEVSAGGNTISGSVGSITRSISINRTPTGVTLNATPGTLTTGMSLGRTISGTSTTSSTVGTVTRSISISRTPTAVNATGSVGYVSTAGIKNVDSSGVTATGSVGTVGWTKGVTLIGLVAEVFTAGYSSATNYKFATLSGVGFVGTVNSFYSTIPTIPITGVKSRARVGSFRYYRPSINIYSTLRYSYNFTTTKVRYEFSIPASKLKTFDAKDKSYRLEQTRLIHFECTRPGALTYV